MPHVHWRLTCLYVLCSHACTSIHVAARPPRLASLPSKGTAHPIQSTHPIESPTVCYASHEIECFHRLSGGLGRAFLKQAAFLKRHGYSVRLIALSLSPDESPSKQAKCTTNEDAILVEDDVVYPPYPSANLNYLPSSYQSLQLLAWLEQNREACAVLHVPDCIGDGMYAASAKRAGVAFRRMHINVQVHGSDSLINPASRVMMEENRLYTAIFERLQMKYADSAVFLSRGNVGEYRKIWDLPTQIDIIPNIVDQTNQVDNVALTWRADIQHILFYGKMTEGKGLGLFVRAMNLCSPTILNGKTIHLVGPRWDDKDYLEGLYPLQNSANVSLLAHYNLTTIEAQRLFQDHQKDGIVVLPTLIEHQSYALFDVMQSNVPFIASNIFAHQADVPRSHHQRLLFDVTPLHLALKLSPLLVKGFHWSSQPATWVPTTVAFKKWLQWHERVLRQVVKPSSIPAVAGANVSVAINVCRSARHLSRAIASIHRQLLSGDIEVTVVASCPAFWSCSEFEGTFLRSSLAAKARCVSVIGSGRRGQQSLAPLSSRGRSNNFAVTTAKYDVVLLMDQNDELVDGGLHKLVLALLKNPDKSVVSSFVNTFDTGSSDVTLRGRPVQATRVFVGSAPELGFLENRLGARHMLVHRDRSFWNASLGFLDDPSSDCDEWSFYQKSALADALILIPQPLVMRQEIEDDRTGWGAERKLRNNVAYVRCKTGVVKDAILFLNQRQNYVDLRRVLSTMLYLVSFYDNAS